MNCSTCDVNLGAFSHYKRKGKRFALCSNCKALVVADWSQALNVRTGERDARYPVAKEDVEALIEEAHGIRASMLRGDLPDDINFDGIFAALERVEAGGKD